MRAVSGRIRRIAVVITFATAVFAHASIASAEQKQSKETLLTSIIVWLQSRLDVPGG